MSLPTIAGVMLASFTVTVAYLWWQREPTVAAVAIPAPTRRAATVPTIAAAKPPATLAPPLAAAQVTPLPQRATLPTAEAEVAPDPDQDPPLMMNVVPNRVFVLDEQTGSQHRVLKDTYDLILTNQSEKSIDIEVTETTLATQDKANFAFTLAKGNQRHIGVREGLPMQSGDELAIKAAKYRQLTASIPY